MRSDGAELGEEDFAEIGEAAKITQQSESSIRRRLADPDDDYPRPVEFSPRVHKWIRFELHDWVKSRVAARGNARAG